MSFYWPPLACAFLWTFPICACWKLAIKQSLGFASWQAWSGVLTLKSLIWSVLPNCVVLHVCVSRWHGWQNQGTPN
jgi:hypothetical protein